MAGGCSRLWCGRRCRGELLTTCCGSELSQCAGRSSEVHVIQLDMDPLRWVEGFSEECTQRYVVCVCVCVCVGGEG